MKRARKLKAIRNKSRGTWVCFPEIEGRRTTRKLGNLNELTQEQADAKVAEMLRSLRLQAERSAPTVDSVVKQYRAENLSKLRHSTQRAANSWLKRHILPKWGSSAITDLQPRPVELWLDLLPLAPRTRGHIRELLHRLVDFNMWAGLIPVATNPIGLVTVRGSSKRRRQPRSLKVAEFHALSSRLAEPFKTMALIQVCLAVRGESLDARVEES